MKAIVLAHRAIDRLGASVVWFTFFVSVGMLLWVVFFIITAM